MQANYRSADVKLDNARRWDIQLEKRTLPPLPGLCYRPDSN